MIGRRESSKPEKGAHPRWPADPRQRNRRGGLKDAGRVGEHFR